MTSFVLLFEEKELFENKEISLFSFLFEASIDAINPNTRSLRTNVLLSSISASFCSSKSKI